MTKEKDLTSSAASAEITLYGFPRSTYLNVARVVLLAKQLPFTFHDTESEMSTDAHRQRHPFDRVPVLKHGDFYLYETSAIAQYVDESFDGPPLQPADAKRRALGHQWISNTNAYIYPYMIYYLVHERVVFAELGIPADEDVVAYSLPKIELALQVITSQLQHKPFIVDDQATLADYFLLPSLSALGFASEGAALLEKFTLVQSWLSRMGKLPAVVEMRAMLPPPSPIEHARRWPAEHRPHIKSRTAEPLTT